MGLDGGGLCVMLGGSAAGAGCLWTTRFVGRLSRAVAVADTSGFIGDVFVCVTLGRCSFCLGGAAVVPSSLLESQVLVWAMLVVWPAVVGSVCCRVSTGNVRRLK